MFFREKDKLLARMTHVPKKRDLRYLLMHYGNRGNIRVRATSQSVRQHICVWRNSNRTIRIRIVYWWHVRTTIIHQEAPFLSHVMAHLSYGNTARAFCACSRCRIGGLNFFPLSILPFLLFSFLKVLLSETWPHRVGKFSKLPSTYIAKMCNKFNSLLLQQEAPIMASRWVDFSIPTTLSLGHHKIYMWFWFPCLPYFFPPYPKRFGSWR